jgi:type IV pilus assembly protein PilA
MNRNSRGFTLIELLIVVVIIGILAAIAIPKFAAVREKGLRAAMMSDLKNLASAQEIYFNSNYTFSTVLADLDIEESSGVTITIDPANAQGWAAIAVHSAIPGEQCGIFHGDAPAANGAPATVPSVVTCSF